MIRNTKKSNYDNDRNFLETGIDLAGRNIHLSDDIDAPIISHVIKGIQLMAQKSQEPINIFINTFGGCPYSSLALYDFIRALDNIVVRTYNLGCCMSGGTLIFLAGDERYTYPNSVFMFHTVSSTSQGKLHELVDESDECNRIFDRMLLIYGNHSKLSSKEWRKKLRYHNVYIRSEEANELGLLTGIIQGRA